jgi:hypothetical protein
MLALFLLAPFQRGLSEIVTRCHELIKVPIGPSFTTCGVPPKVARKPSMSGGQNATGAKARGVGDYDTDAENSSLSVQR